MLRRATSIRPVAVAAAFACALTACAKEPPRSAAHVASASPSPNERDTSLSLEEYRAAGVPALDRAWGAPEHDLAAAALERLAASRPDALPSVDSPRSGPLFERLVKLDERDLSPDRAPGARMASMATFHGRLQRLLRVYLPLVGDHGRRHGRDTLAILASAVHLAKRSWEIVDVFAPTLDTGDPTYGVRMGGIDRMRMGTAEEIQGSLVTLGEDYPKDVLASFASAIADDLASLKMRLSPAEYRLAHQTLDVLVSHEKDERLAPALRRLRSALEAHDAADLTITDRAIEGRQGRVIVALPADRTHGAPGEAKRSGPTDLYVVPLANAIEPPKGGRPFVIDVDGSTPYRLLVEVLFTASQREIVSFDLRLRGQEHVRVVMFPPRVGTTKLAPDGLHLVAILVEEGVSLKARGGNVAPGCDDTGPGIAIPRHGSRLDVEALGACARKLKALVPTERGFVFSANPAVAFTDMLAAIEPLRGERLELFPELTLGLAR